MYEIKSPGVYGMGKKVEMEFDYMYEDRVMSHVVVYVDGEVAQINYTDNLVYRALREGAVYRDVEELFKGMIFDERRPDKREVLDSFGLIEYDPIEIIKKTRGVMSTSKFWIRFKGDTVTWSDLRGMFTIIV